MPPIAPWKKWGCLGFVGGLVAGSSSHGQSIPKGRASLSRFHLRPSAMAGQPRSMIIEGNPIGKGLDAFRDSFSLICEGAYLPCNPDALEQLGQEGLHIHGPAGKKDCENCLQQQRRISRG